MRDSKESLFMRGGCMKIKSIILAAGQSKRMNSKTPKIIHKVAGVPLVEHIVNVANEISDIKPIVIIGHKIDVVKDALEHLNVKFVIQEIQLGTGNAVKIAVDHLQNEQNVLILCGDTPLIKVETIKKFINDYKEKKSDLSVLTMKIPNPIGYGRIVRENTRFLKIVEEKDADDIQKKIYEVNAGIYLIKGELLKKHINDIKNDNKQKEYYLTDLIEIFSKQKYNVTAYCSENYCEFLGVNNRVQLAEVEKIMRKTINEELMMSGVTIIDPQNTYIEKNVKVGEDTIIYPNTTLKGNTIIGKECIIGPGTVIENSILGNNITVNKSQVISSNVGFKTKIGPFANIRPGCNISTEVKIGDFVEIKNSNIGKGTKISHLTYVGDGDVGENVNIGCGVVFVNYDGSNKYRTIVKDNSFIGCNVNLIAPVTISKNVYIAAGTTVTEDVEEGSLAIGRKRQKNIEGWVSKKQDKNRG